MGPWLSFPDQAKGEKVSDIAHECVRHIGQRSGRVRRDQEVARGQETRPTMG